jgi:hypothetical protein
MDKGEAGGDWREVQRRPKLSTDNCIDSWAAAPHDPPSRPETIRRLVELGLGEKSKQDEKIPDASGANILLRDLRAADASPDRQAGETQHTNKEPDAIVRPFRGVCRQTSAGGGRHQTSLVKLTLITLALRCTTKQRKSPRSS